MSLVIANLLNPFEVYFVFVEIMKFRLHSQLEHEAELRSGFQIFFFVVVGGLPNLSSCNIFAITERIIRNVDPYQTFPQGKSLSPVVQS